MAIPPRATFEYIRGTRHFDRRRDARRFIATYGDFASSHPQEERIVHRLPLIGIAAGTAKRLPRALAFATVALASLLAAVSPNAEADDAGFARSKKCMNCHAVDEKLVGPAFKAVAARYINDKDAEARLAKKIREGGSGAWGVVPMPANDVTTAEAQRLAHWALMQK